MPCKKTVFIYQDPNGREPFLEWYKSIKDKMIKARIQNRIRRMEQGNYGDWKSLGNGVFEFRLDFGSGYRVYFGEMEKQIVVLLAGGDKSSQTKDIKQAHECWNEYKESLQ